jgi:hypothetical protein
VNVTRRVRKARTGMGAKILGVAGVPLPSKNAAKAGQVRCLG